MTTTPDGPGPRVEVIPSVQRRRRWSTAEKLWLAEESMQPGSAVLEKRVRDLERLLGRKTMEAES